MRPEPIDPNERFFMTTLDPSAPSTSAGASPQPGWYPDPQDPEGPADRWWNGVAWSEHTRRTSIAVPPGAPVPPVASVQNRSLVLHNGPAWWSLGLGLLALTLAIVVLVSDADYVWLSTSGVIAVFNGIRALRLRSAGLASQLAAPIIGIVAGSIGTMLMLILLLVPVHFFVSSDDTLDGPTADAAAPLQQSLPQSSAAHAPAAAGTPTGPLQVQPPTPLPDDMLSTYRGVAIRQVTAAAAGCGVLTNPETGMPLPRSQETEARHMQDWLSWESQGIRGGLQRYARTTTGWPTRLDEDPQTRTLFAVGSSGSCDVIGSVPLNAEIRYAMSPDHGQVAVALYSSALKVGTLWRSVDDTEYFL